MGWGWLFWLWSACLVPVSFRVRFCLYVVGVSASHWLSPSSGDIAIPPRIDGLMRMESAGIERNPHW